MHIEPTQHGCDSFPHDDAPSVVAPSLLGATVSAVASRDGRSDWVTGSGPVHAIDMQMADNPATVVRRPSRKSVSKFEVLTTTERTANERESSAVLKQALGALGGGRDDLVGVVGPDPELLGELSDELFLVV